MPSTTNSAKSLLTKSNKAKILKEEREREKKACERLSHRVSVIFLDLLCFLYWLKMRRFLWWSAIVCLDYISSLSLRW